MVTGMVRDLALGYGQFGAVDPLARAGPDWSFAMIPRRSLLLADIGNGSAAIACFKSATRAALSESSRSTVTIYKGTKCRLSCCHLVQGAPRSGLSQRPGERSTPKLIVRPVILSVHAGLGQTSPTDPFSFHILNSSVNSVLAFLPGYREPEKGRSGLLAEWRPITGDM